MIANVNKTWPQCVVECTFQIFEPLTALDSSQTLELASGGKKETNQAPLALFQVFKTYSATRVELHIETCEFPTLLKMCLSPVLARPGVSVCD